MSTKYIFIAVITFIFCQQVFPQVDTIKVRKSILTETIDSMVTKETKDTLNITPKIYIVDGDTVPDLSKLDPDKIASISILKKSAMQPITDPVTVEITTKEEYEAIVLDAGFDAFVATQHPKEFYSEQTLKIKNTFMVNEWNYRYKNPLQYNPSIYEAEIDYNPKNDYGLDVEYTLYMFFRYMDKIHGTKLERK